MPQWVVKAIKSSSKWKLS